MTPPTLLAKSRVRGRALTLEEHSIDTWAVARSLFSSESALLRAFATSFRLSESEVGLFVATLEVACLAHDMGKANADFYQLMLGERSKAQALRHEHLSALLLYSPRVRTWLRSSQVIDYSAVVTAVLSHHVKADSRANQRYSFADFKGTSVTLYFDHPEVTRILDQMADVAKLPRLAGHETPQVITARPDDPWVESIEAIIDDSRRLAQRMRDPAHGGFHAAVKAALIACDTVASASFRESFNCKSWSTAIASRDRLTAEAIEVDIIAPRVRHLQSQGTWTDWHRFQLLAEKLSAKAFIGAACGRGKTLAAYRWAKAQAKARDVGHLLFLYPTQGTATEGFRDYIGWAPEGSARLLHSNASEALVGMLANCPASLTNKLSQDALQEQAEAESRMYALAHWSTRYFSATADQFLSFLENDYRGIALLPVLLDSIVIIDEVHAFDERMFASLIQLLTRLDLPVLLMSASLSTHRRAQLQHIGVQLYPSSEHRQELEDLRVSEEQPRYQHHRSTHGECLDIARAAIRLPIAGRGARILWVTNTVRSCVETAKALTATVDSRVLTYHSRYRLCDREASHTEVVRAFAAPDPVIAVTTQVCEMSLDLDADIIISEYAPMTALIQRWGRGNRKPGRSPGYLAPVYTYAPEGLAPYTRDQIDKATVFLSALNNPISQADLEVAMLQVEAENPDPIAHHEGGSFFLGGYMAVTSDYRLLDQRDCTAVLDTDLPHLNIDTYKRHTLSVPRDQVLTDVPRPPWLPRWVHIADGTRYSAQYGYATWSDR